MERRKFLKAGVAATASAASTVGVMGMTAAEATVQPRIYTGPDLLGWETVVGDGVYARPGQAQVSLDDISTKHLGQLSELQANVAGRGVMAHNISFKRIIDDLALGYHHVASFEFRIPFTPSMTNTGRNAQTFEGGLFIWDGSGDRRDHGLAFQWLLNPWMDNYGQVYKWSMSRAGWKPVRIVQPDTEWHTVSVELDPRTRSAELCLDGLHIDRVYTRRRKPAHWGLETAARLQAEIISLDPGPHDSAPMHVAEVRNWHWAWSL